MSETLNVSAQNSQKSSQKDSQKDFQKDSQGPENKRPQKKGLLGGLSGLRLTLTAGISAAILLAWLVLAILGPWVAPHGEADIISNQTYAPIGEGGLLGTDKLGRDVFSRLIYGVRTTLVLALITTVICFLFGVTLGFAAAILRGWFDIVVSRVVEAFMAFPSIMLALVVIGAFGTSETVLVLTVGLVMSTSVFRVSRALGYDIGVMDFVEAARARGERTSWILAREILPNTMAPLIAEFGLRFTFSILFLSGLSFLGLGVQEPEADWGLMVQENVGGLVFGSSAALIPAACIASLTISMNLLVDWFQQRQQGETVLEAIDK